ncbi:MAG: Crp/Fnr family transcriptional regulator [Spirochaetales bacterium]|nr:Crp/Fnr family transcriptional regulator [Spirochaetales bacterium]
MAPTRFDAHELLKHSDFFRGISERSIRSLAAVCIPKRVDKRSLVFLEGQEGHSMYILAEGAVQLHKTASDGRQIVIKTIQAGEIFGEVVLFEENEYPVSAVALEDSLLLRLSRQQMDCLLLSDGFRREFIGMLMRKQRYLADRILYLTGHEVQERFFFFLREQFGRRRKYRISLSKKDIAAAIGTIPETFSRLLLRLKEEGKIRWEGETLELAEGFWKEFERREP